MEELEFTKETKALRVSIDRCIKEARSLAAKIARSPGGREIALSITQLQQGKHWAGEALGEFGHKLPEEFRDEA